VLQFSEKAPTRSHIVAGPMNAYNRCSRVATQRGTTVTESFDMHTGPKVSRTLFSDDGRFGQIVRS
jgi:hypothetical protein